MIVIAAHERTRLKGGMMDKLIAALGLREGKGKTVLLVAVLLLVLVSWLGVVDKKSTQYVDESIVQASLAFASARLLNGAISTLQSTSITIGFGSGVDIGVGQVLDPFNDLVEQYSSLMKLALGSLVIQKILLEIISDSFFKVLITLSGVLLIGSALLRTTAYSGVLFKTFVFLVFIRFSLVLVVALNGMVDYAFLAEKTRDELAVLQDFSSDVDEAEEASGPTEEEKAALLEQKAALEGRLAGVDSEMATLNERIRAQEEVLSTAQEDLRKIEESKSTVEKYNFLSRDETHQAALTRRDEALEQLKELQEEMAVLVERSAEVAEQVAALENTLAGKANSMFESIGKGFSGLADKASKLGGDSIAKLKQRLEEATTSIINAMSMFFLKTMILPLLFLWALVKVTKAVWGVDMEPWLRKQVEPKRKKREDLATEAGNQT